MRIEQDGRGLKVEDDRDLLKEMDFGTLLSYKFFVPKIPSAHEPDYSAWNRSEKRKTWTTMFAGTPDSPFKTLFFFSRFFKGYQQSFCEKDHFKPPKRFLEKRENSNQWLFEKNIPVSSVYRTLTTFISFIIVWISTTVFSNSLHGY